MSLPHDPATGANSLTLIGTMLRSFARNLDDTATMMETVAVPARHAAYLRFLAEQLRNTSAELGGMAASIAEEVGR